MSVGSEYQKAKVARQLAYIRQIKESTPCVDCGESYPYYVMQFDHVHGEKGLIFGHLQRRWVNREKLEAELLKCEVVCANCHAARTFRRSKER